MLAEMMGAHLESSFLLELGSTWQAIDLKSSRTVQFARGFPTMVRPAEGLDQP